MRKKVKVVIALISFILALSSCEKETEIIEKHYIETVIEAKYENKTVEDFGAVGDGLTDDTKAWQDAAKWFSEASYRKLTTADSTIYRITGPVVFDFAGNVGSQLDMSSPIVPDAFGGDVFSFINGRDHELTLYVDGGGITADYSQETPDNGQNVFLIRGLRNCIFAVKARGCKSRIMKVDNAQDGELKTSLNVFKSILTGDLEAGGSPNGPCGQAIWANGTTAFGTIQVAHTNWDDYGPVFNKVVDMTIEHWEGGWNKNHGAIFKGCGSLYIHSIAVGGSREITTLKFMAADDGTQPFTTNILSGLSVGGLRGIHIEDVNSGTQGFNVKNFKTTSNGEIGFYLKNVQNSILDIQSTYDHVGCRVAGSSAKLTLNVDIRESRGAGLQLANTIMGVEVSGIIERCAKSVAGANVEVETVVDNVKFINLMNRSTEALSTGCYILPEGNKISIIGGLVSGQAIFPAYKPQFAQNVDGFKTENNGEYSFDQASNTVTISHGLAMTPASVDITPTSDLATTWFISDVNASTFTVTFSSAVSSGSFKWTASAY